MTVTNNSNMIKFTHRIPTDMYAYVEFEEAHEDVREAMVKHAEYIKMYSDKAGLNTKQWAEVRNKLMSTGEFDPNLFDELSKAQRYAVNEIKNAFRALTQD